ncbi:SLC12A7 [Symbiodinium sp. CCMP2592]|nr:SLC12A7 [Symbiodinium sp. CCMP2592]
MRRCFQIFLVLLISRHFSRLPRVFIQSEEFRPQRPRRQALAGVLLASLTPTSHAVAEDRVQTAASPVSVGLIGDELVYPRWFVGTWATVGELYKVETGPLGENALSAALPRPLAVSAVRRSGSLGPLTAFLRPGTPAAMRKNNGAVSNLASELFRELAQCSQSAVRNTSEVGMEAGVFRARRRWMATERVSPEGGAGAEEDRGGVPAGAAAAAYAVGGPAPRLKKTETEGLWEVAGRWKLQAAGAVARADPEIPGGLRVSELFELRPLDQDKLSAAVRIVTIWKEAKTEGSEQLQLDLRDIGEFDKSRGRLLQAVQVAYLLPEPSSPSEKNFGSVTTRFVYSPIRCAGTDDHDQEASPMWKSYGPGGGSGYGDWQEDQISIAVSQALSPILSKETEWDQAKLEKRVKQYFRNAAKGLEFYSKTWTALIEEYSDTVFASLFQALKDRPWLVEVDFLMVIDAAVKELFPKQLLKNVPQLTFESQVLHAHDRAFEEQRFAPMLWDILFEKIQDKPLKNKIYNAFEAGRKEAALSGGDGSSPAGDFIHAWVTASLRELQQGAASPAMLGEQLSPELCKEIFHELLEAGALPLQLTKESGAPPESTMLIDSVVEDVYSGRLELPPPSIGRGAVAFRTEGPMASRMPSWRRTGARARESHFDGLEKGAWVEFPGYDNRGRQQGHVVAYLVEAGDDRQMKTGRVFEGHVVAIQDGYYDYWVEQTYGAYTLDRIVPLHFCGSPQSSCRENTMYRHPIHVDVFRLLGMDQVLQVGWLTEEDKARAGAHPGLVGEAPGLGGAPPDPNADPAALGVQTGLPGVAGLAEALGAPGQGATNEAAEQKKKEKEKKEKGETKDELLAEISKRSPAGRRERSALELTRGSSSKEKKRKRRSSSSDEGESDDSSFQLAALPKGVEKIREMHRRHPGRLASLTLQRCSELLAQAHGGVMATSERAKLPAVARGYFQLIYLTAHPAIEIGARNFKELSTIVAVIDAVAENDPLRALDILVQRLKAIELAHLQGNWTQAEQLELVKTGEWSAMFQQELKAAQQEVRTDWSLRQGPRRTPRWEGRSWWTETAADEGAQGAGEKAADGNNDKAPDNRPKGRGAKGKGKGKKGKATAGPRVRLEPLEIPILKRVLDSMPEEIGEQRAQIDGHLANAKVAAFYKEVMSRVATPKTEEEAAYHFAGIVIDNIDLPSETLLEILSQKFGVLAEQDGPQVSKAFAELFGLGVPATDSDMEASGRLLGRHNGVEVREYYPGWRGSDGGIYVGRGGNGLPCSVFQEPYYEQLVVGQVKEALDGRALYVHQGEEDAAYGAISTYVLGQEAQPVWNEAVWKKWLGFWLLGRPTAPASFLGVVLSLGLRARPGPLGTFIRVLPCCAKEHFKQSPVELLPMALPKESPEMVRVMKVMLEAWGAHDLPSETWLEIVEQTSLVGVEAWTWLQVALLNHLWAGSNHILGQGLLHPASWTAAQKVTGERLRGYAELFVEGKETIEIGSWESLRQSLGDMYAGREVQKAYKLSWAAIAPHVPEPGEAGRISLAETVDPALRPYVEDPELLRIPDQELGEAVTSASVLVESREEYDLIVSHLVEAGMLEREVPEETLRIRGEPVYNGMFGVHKGWQEQADGTWLRTLRLIINLIPSNQVQSRVPGQPSAHMGYSPIWGQIALLEDEVILCYAEDVRHCFHIFAPSPKWRGYFVIGKVAASSCFNDGKGSLHSRPRVKSAPMGWSNIVDFIQSSLERFGSLAGVPAERVVRMGEPAPLMPLSTPRDYHSFYVDNYDGFKVVAACDAGIYEGRPSDAQLQLREVFKVWSVGRDPKKAAEGTLVWSSLGAEQLGDRGLVGSARKLRWAVLGATLRILCAEPGEPRGSQELLSVVGKAMHSVQFCRPLACLFDQLYREMSEGPGPMRVTKSF